MKKLPEEVIAEGKISDTGHFIPDIPAALQHELKKFVGMKVILKIVAWTQRRSIKHNNYYWARICDALSDYTGYTKEEVHLLLRQMFASEVRYIADKNGEMIEEVKIPTRTSKMSKAEFTQYVQKCERLCDECGIVDKLKWDGDKYDYAEIV